MARIKPRRIEALREGIDDLVRRFRSSGTIELPDAGATLSLSEAHALLFVHRNDGCIASEMAAHLFLPATTLSSMVDRLVKKNLLERARTEENRRVVRLHTTELGAMGAQHFLAEQLDHCEQMLTALTASEQLAFIEYVDKIALALRETPNQK